MTSAQRTKHTRPLQQPNLPHNRRRRTQPAAPPSHGVYIIALSDPHSQITIVGLKELSALTNGKTERGAGFWIGTISTVVGAVVAIAAAVIAFSQADLSKRQNELGDRQSLATLVGEIEQQTRQLVSTPISLRTRVEEARLADAEQAGTLVEALKGAAPTIDKFLVGDAFADAGEDYVALILLNEAAKDTRSPHYRAAALRLEAIIRYELGGVANDKDAEYDADLAYTAYDGQPDLAPLVGVTNEAYTDVYDVRRVAGVNCPLALKQYREVVRLADEYPSLLSNLTIRTPLQYAKLVVRRC
jgi:hypothetical protein